jgi:hypothetical protein
MQLARERMAFGVVRCSIPVNVVAGFVRNRICIGDVRTPPVSQLHLRGTR